MGGHKALRDNSPWHLDYPMAMTLPEPDSRALSVVLSSWTEFTAKSSRIHLQASTGSSHSNSAFPFAHDCFISFSLVGLHPIFLPPGSYLLLNLKQIVLIYFFQLLFWKGDIDIFPSCQMVVSRLISRAASICYVLIVFCLRRANRYWQTHPIILS